MLQGEGKAEGEFKSSKEDYVTDPDILGGKKRFLRKPKGGGGAPSQRGKRGKRICEKMRFRACQGPREGEPRKIFRDNAGGKFRKSIKKCLFLYLRLIEM